MLFSGSEILNKSSFSLSTKMTTKGLVGALFLLGILGLPISGQAQQPTWLPAEIPLDLDSIYEPLSPELGYERTTRQILDQLKRYHYDKITLDDAFADTMMDGYLKILDGARYYFTAEDVAHFDTYRTTLDELLQKGDVRVGFEMFNLYQKRIEERLLTAIKTVENPNHDYQFDLNESIEFDRSETPWAENEAALRELWRKQVKSAVLNLKLTDKPMDEVFETLSKRYRSQLSQVLKTKPLDVYQRYMDAMTFSFDPHSQWYAPRAAENFNMSMRLSLEGIGAVLTTEDEYTKVVSIVTGGPADLTGELHPADKIIGVAQGDESFVDVIGWRVDDVVELVRGEKGSVVRLNVIPSSSQSSIDAKVINITRDTVKLEDSSAKKEIVEITDDFGAHRIGVITLPAFYIDFEALQRRDPEYKSTTRDVHKLIDELKEENIEGLIIDLRQNGGGSLSEANSLAGLFITRGPTVQVRDADRNNIVQGDSDPTVVYDGPLAVLVNRLSASASEIFAGAIQDYQRGIVVGSQTFGKGTVQELLKVDEGQLKITRAKFYRISGASTQHQGVMPDIILPDLYDAAEDIGESSLPTALPWDTIDPHYYRAYSNLKQQVPTLAEASSERMSKDPDFTHIREQITHMLERRDRNELTLNEVALKADREAEDAWRLAAENRRRAAKGMELLDEIDDVNDEESSGVRASAVDNSSQVEEANNLSQVDESSVPTEQDDSESDDKELDPYYKETAHILLDLKKLEEEDTLTLALRRSGN
jgi:carboxyl-terminal processing protease